MIQYMRAEEITRLLKRRPFEPFGLYLSDGSSYAVRHPDQVIVTPRAAYVGVGRDGGGEPIVQDVVICDLVHVTRLGPAPDASDSKTE